jgi:hypothetical protein
MNRKTVNLLSVAVLSLFFFASCTSLSKSMREPNVRVNLVADDFAVSDQVSGTASSTKILSIDWQRLFNNESAEVSNGTMNISLASIPVVGSSISDRTVNYALYNLMYQNPGYDVVIYPQYTTKVQRPFLGLGFIYSKTTVKATARLGKLKSK